MKKFKLLFAALLLLPVFMFGQTDCGEQAKKTAEAKRDEAKNQKELAEKYSQEGNCAAAKDAAMAADNAAKAAEDAAMAYKDALEPPVGDCPSGSNNVDETNLACIEDVPDPEYYDFTSKVEQLLKAGNFQDKGSGNDIKWTLDSWSDLWQCSDPDGDGTYTFGRTFYFRISDACGNEMPALCGVTYSGACQPLVFYTQEAWGNEGGSPVIPEDGTALQTNMTLLNMGPLMIGGPDRSLTLTSAQCVQALLPGIGNPTVLIDCQQVNCTTGCNPAGPIGMKNILAANTVALVLNMRLNVHVQGLTMENVRNQSLGCVEISPNIKHCVEGGGCKLQVFESNGKVHEFAYTLGGLLDLSNLYLNGGLQLKAAYSTIFAAAMNNALKSVHAYWNGSGPAAQEGSTSSAGNTVEPGGQSPEAFASINAIAQDARAAANAADAAANGCVPKSQKPDYVKQAQDARDEARGQRGLAFDAASRGDCDAARTAARTARLAAADAANAADAATRAAKDAEVSASDADAAAAYNAASDAASAASAASDAADAADEDANGCKTKPQTPPAPAKAPGAVTATPTLGGGVGAAQSSADVGYCYHKDGTPKVIENSKITFQINMGMTVLRNIIAGGASTSSLERPRSPYASFASYRPSASGNAGHSPVPPVQGGQLNLMSLNLGVNYLHLEGKDRYPERGASFDKKMVEVLATGDFYFINLLRAKRATSSPKVAPFVRLGAGFGIGNPNTVNGDKGDKKANFALPMGLGFRVNVTDKMALNLDYTTRATFSDALDGITGTTDNNDWYGSGGLGLSFMLGKKANDSDGDGVKNNDDPCPTVAGTMGGCPDTDGDGLADKDDSCPNEAGEQRLSGCPDTDGDGVANNMDDCPDDAGLRRFSGCPDTDGDNIIDKEDRCPTVPGLAAINGCPDADRDGVTDDKDECPDDPGPAEQNGCPDTDNDGVADSKDECPKIFGLGKFNGCPDTDEDGIADPKDKCPNLKGAVSNEGCPEIDAQDKAVLDLAMRNVKFRTGSAELLSSSKKYLDQIAEVMSRYKGFKLSIDGYTDNQGLAATNQSLSEARARACYDYLSSIGVKLSLMTYAGHGPTNPIGDNSTEEGRLKNRRVEFKLIPQ